MDVYSSDVWWQGYLRCQSAATAESLGEWEVFCHRTNDSVAVDVSAWEAELDGAPPADGAIRAGLSWRGGSWYHRPSENSRGGERLVEEVVEPAKQSRTVRRQLVADAVPDGVHAESGELTAKPLMTPAAVQALFVSRQQLQAFLELPGNDAAAVCRIIPGALVRSFTDPESAFASRLWVVASATVLGTTGGLASIELREAGSTDGIFASALCKTAPTGLDVAAWMTLPAFAELTLGGCRETAARLAAAQGKCIESARSVLQPADAAAHAALVARYGELATAVFDPAASLPPPLPHSAQVATGAPPARRALSAAALPLRPCSFHRCRKLPEALALPRYWYYPPLPAERVPAGPFCVACLSQWSKQMQDDFGLWPEGCGPPACVSYGSVMRDARAVGALG